MRARSLKRARQYRERRALVARLLSERPFCEIRWDAGCEVRSCDVDEILGRGVGGDFLDPANCQTACRYCHDRKHQNPAEAVRRGVTVQRRASCAGEDDGCTDQTPCLACPRGAA